MDMMTGRDRKHDFLGCIDSDGTAFDNMELKHKECFCPAAVNVWGLQSVSRYFREVWAFVNLYGRSRGINRFPGIVKALEITAEREEVKRRGYVLPDLEPLKTWVNTTESLSCSALERYSEEPENDAAVLKTAIRWSHEVDESVARIAHDVSPFPNVREVLKALSEFADIAVISAAPKETIWKEWEKNSLLEYVSVMAGQEMGSKTACIKAVTNGRYADAQVLMIGDTLGDHRAALENGVLFFPIIPGEETESWQRLLDESQSAFLEGRYADILLYAFCRGLRQEAPWEKTSREGRV